MPRHNTSLCKDCFTEFLHTQVRRAIKSHRMFAADDRILVAVSGGKDSLTLWGILLKLGYRADALYVDLGIGDYSGRSKQKVQRFTDTVAAAYQSKLHVHTVEQEQGAGIRELATLVHRPTCSTCGTMKRYQFNRVAVEQDYDVMATGHNLDDEAARLLGNVLHWQTDYLDKQTPSLPASLGWVCQEGQTPVSPDGAGNRSLCGHPSHRLHCGGMPDGQGLQVAGLQTRFESTGGGLAREPSKPFI